jgi:hypothetical protein
MKAQRNLDRSHFSGEISVQERVFMYPLSGKHKMASPITQGSALGYLPKAPNGARLCLKTPDRAEGEVIEALSAASDGGVSPIHRRMITLRGV